MIVKLCDRKKREKNRKGMEIVMVTQYEKERKKNLFWVLAARQPVGKKKCQGLLPEKIKRKNYVQSNLHPSCVHKVFTRWCKSARSHSLSQICIERCGSSRTGNHWNLELKAEFWDGKCNAMCKKKKKVVHWREGILGLRHWAAGQCLHQLLMCDL